MATTLETDTEPLVNPFKTPTPYDVLGMDIATGLMASAREIGRAHSKEMKKARKLRDTKDKARRNEELDGVRDLLVRPDDRVLVDFFLLSDRVIGDICLTLGRKMTAGALPVEPVLGSLNSDRRYDDLIPEKPARFEAPLSDVELPEFRSSLAANQRVPLTEIKL